MFTFLPDIDYHKNLVFGRDFGRKITIICTVIHKPSTLFCSIFICSIWASYCFMFTSCSFCLVSSWTLDKAKASVAWADFSRSLAALAALSKAVESKEYCWERYPSTSCPTVPTPAGPPAPEIKFRKCYNVWKLVISNLVLITAKAKIPII